MDDTTLNSSDAAAAMDHRNLELLMMIVIHSLLRKEGANDDVVDEEQQMKEMVRECSMAMLNNRRDQLAISNVIQRLLDAQLRLLDGGEKARVVASSSDSASDHHLMDGAAAAKKKEKTAAAAAKEKTVAAAKKKKRNKRNKAAAKHKGTKRMSWLGGGIISLLMMAAFGFGSIMTLSRIPQSDGSSEGNKAPPTLPPSASTSLRQRDLQSSNMASVSPSSVSPFAAVVRAPIFSPAAASNRRMNSVAVDERALSTCFDTPAWEDKDGYGCKEYEEYDEPGCPYYGNLFEGNMGVANDNCCYCGGGSHTLPPTTSPTITSSPTKSASPTELCFDTPAWENLYGEGCEVYEEHDDPGCPKFGSLFEGNMGVANDNCCHCGGGSHSLPPTTSPTASSSPTKSATPSSSPSSTPSISPTKSATPSSAPSSAPSMCTDTLGWYDFRGHDCVWYEVVDVPGCPRYGNQTAHNSSTAEGSANDNCCYCQNTVVRTLSPTKAPSSSGTCVDTPGWRDYAGWSCELYRRNDVPGCPELGYRLVGEMGPAAENCCYCKDPTCERFNWKCQQYTNSTFWWTSDPDQVASVCDEAASCSCEAADHINIKVVTNLDLGYNETVGLYNECKCDFWLRLCSDSLEGDACDYAAEYCCGDYMYFESQILEGFLYWNSLCYCDFSEYAENEFEHTLKPKALNISKEFLSPCQYLEGDFGPKIPVAVEKESLEAVYNSTNGNNWKNNEGWMDETVEHCQWYGISCDDEGYVTSIDLRDNNLEGQFPVYTRNAYDGFPILIIDWYQSKYGLPNLYKLKTLDLSNNKLNGTIEYRPLYNLNALTHFDVSGNQLSGEVEVLVAPSLKYVDFSNNNFTSVRRFQKYKVRSLRTLRYCDVSNNVIQQDATDLLENIPPNIVQFIASNNQIYGNLPESLNNLQKLRQFNMASNALSGKLPGFTESFATLQELDMSNQTNGFTGSIPENVWRSLSLKTLNLAGNRLTGTIPSLVGNLAVLETFDLSNNLLGSSLPSELGILEGSLKRLDLTKNMFTGVIPSQIGQLQGASVFLKDNRFYNSSTTAPLSLCLEREVKEFDLENDTTLCPIERNALSDFYDSAKGEEWTNRSLWLHEYESYCYWKGVTCDNENHVTELNLTNNGLSGRLSESIGNLIFMKVLDLSDNDIKGSIPMELGKLSNLTYLRLSYNAFTGAAPEGLGEMTQLQLLQLQSNRITEMPNIPRLNSIHGQSTFVTDCGVPSAFDEALDCKNCTMCCNANDDCYPQGETQVEKMGLEGYGTFAALVFGCFVVLCCVISFLLLFIVDKRKNHGITLTTAMETRIKEDDEYALSKIGKDSVYSYFVTDKVFGWLTALATVVIQILILVVFIIASETNLQYDATDIQFTWKCPRDTDVCENKADLTEYGWAIFSVLMIAFLAKDMIGGSKLIYHSAKIRHSLSSRIRYFFGGMCLCSITLFALYVSIVYNKAIATSNTEIILNSVVVLFIMDLDEWIFSTLAAINKKWTAHAEDGTIDEMKEQIKNQAEELRRLRKEMREITLRTSRNGRVIVSWNRMRLAQRIQELQVQRGQMAKQQEELRKLRELVEKIQESQVAAAAASTTTTTTTSV